MLLVLFIILPLIRFASSTSLTLLFRSSRIFRFSNFRGRLVNDDDGVQFAAAAGEGDIAVVTTTTSASLSSSLGDCVISVSDCGSKFASIISFRILSISVGLISLVGVGCDGGWGFEVAAATASIVEYDNARVGGGGRDGLPLLNAMALLSIIISCLPGTN